jgi:hypothetical protein
MVIEQQFAAIGVNVTPAHVEIEMPRLSMNITTENPKMTIDRKAPSFEMDLDPFDGEDALREPDALIGDVFGDGVFKDERKAYSEIADNGVRRGSRSAARKGSRVAAISRRKLMQSARRDIKIKTAPPNRPKVKWDPGYIHIDWSNHRINIDWEGEYIPELTVDPPYSIEIYLRNKPYFRITVEEGASPYQAGQRVDEAV